MPPEMSNEQDNNEMDHLLMQNEAHHKEMMDALDSILVQGADKDPSSLLESSIHLQDKTLKEVSKMTDKQEEAVDELKRLSKQSKDLVSQIIPQERGSRFIGHFKTSGDLPDPEKMKLQPGDYAYVEETGELWKLE